MRYQGGKSRISKQIGDVINLAISRREIENSTTNIDNYQCESEIATHTHTDVTFVSLFCGSCSVESKIDCEHKILNDNHKYLIAMLKAVQNGYELPNEITKDQYSYIKDHKDEDIALSGFVGFACSFGGKWFGGYGWSKNRNHCAESKRTLLKRMNQLHNAEFICNDYKKVIIPNNAIIYADPPYNNTTEFDGNYFDTEAFWEYARDISKTNLIFISEQTAPDDFVPIWEKQVTRTLDRNKDNQFKATEKLFVHNNWVDYMQETLNRKE